MCCVKIESEPWELVSKNEFVIIKCSYIMYMKMKRYGYVIENALQPQEKEEIYKGVGTFSPIFGPNFRSCYTIISCCENVV